MLRSGPDRRPLLALCAVAAIAATGGCTSVPLAERGNRIDFGGQVEFALPATSLIGRRFETVIRQQYDFSCGSAALAALLRYHYEDPQTEQTVFIGMFRDGDRAQIRRLGFSLLDMKRYLANRGIGADGFRVSLEQVAKARLPGIALIDFNGYKHFVVVKGVVGDSVLLGDPSLGLRAKPRAGSGSSGTVCCSCSTTGHRSACRTSTKHRTSSAHRPAWSMPKPNR